MKIIIDNKKTKNDQIEKVIFCSGKVYYDIKEKINKDEESKYVIIRLEQIYPFPQKLIFESISNFINAKFIWCQEEPKNMGAWTFIKPYIKKILDDGSFKNKKIFYAGRKESASTATGLFKRHVIEQEELINSLFIED